MKLPFVLAKRFVAGESFDQAVPKVEELNQKSIKVTLDLLGENVRDRGMADDSVADYKELIENISSAGLDSTISIKLTMLGLDIDKEYCRDNLFDLLETARDHNQFVRIDMEGSDYTEQTVNLFKEAFQEYEQHVGIVIQAYLHRTEQDIAELAELGADVRLCKGAYNEPKEIALQEMNDIRKAFTEYATVLLKETPYPRIATHDDELINWTKTFVREQNIRSTSFEFQMLYGLREPTIEEMTEQGYNTRVYVPFGTMWFPYFKRRLMERKENIWFILSTLFKK